MSRWINVILVYVLLGAVLLTLARVLLPVIGLGPIAEEWIQPLARLTPILLAISLASISLITFSLRRQTKLARRWVEEAENLADIITGEDVEPSGLKAEVPPNGYQQSGRRAQRGFQRTSLRATARLTTATVESEGLGVAAAVSNAALEKTRGERRHVAAETVRDLRRIAPITEAKIRTTFLRRMTMFLRVIAI